MSIQQVNEARFLVSFWADGVSEELQVSYLPKFLPLKRRDNRTTSALVAGRNCFQFRTSTFDPRPLLYLEPNIWWRLFF